MIQGREKTLEISSSRWYVGFATPYPCWLTAAPTASDSTAVAEVRRCRQRSVGVGVVECVSGCVSVRERSRDREREREREASRIKERMQEGVCACLCSPFASLWARAHADGTKHPRKNAPSARTASNRAPQIQKLPKIWHVIAGLHGVKIDRPVSCAIFFSSPHLTSPHSHPALRG
jgi:hypothetical protein